MDLFKQVHDTHGYQVGDEVPKAFAGRIRLKMRGMDSIGCSHPDSTFRRDGGEEFLLLLPYAQSGGSVACLERLRAAVRAPDSDTSTGPLAVTFSAGIAHSQPGESLETLIQRADEALYQAKSQGRDRIVVAHARPPAG